MKFFVAGAAVLVSVLMASATSAAEAGPGLMADMDLRRWPARAFHESYRAQIDALGATHGPERRGVLLDFAELYLGQAMLDEAASVLQSLSAGNETAGPRWHAIDDATRLLSGESIANIQASPLAAATRADRGLWLVLNAIATGNEAELRGNIEAGFAGLSNQSGPVARWLLPVLTGAAIELRNQRLSERGLSLLDEVPELASAPVGGYLRGRAAENRGDIKTAADAYFQSAKGWDRHAARARVALADMALRDGSRGALLAARDVLKSGSDAWRGDGNELQVLQRLAEVYSRLEDSLGALITYAKLMAHFPGTSQAEVAGQKAATDLGRVYSDGAAGGLPLARWVSIHLMLVPSYRYFPDFAGHNEELADRALELGGTVLAANEYRRTLSIMNDLKSLRQHGIAPERFGRVRFKLATALARGGQWAQARAALNNIDTSGDQELRDQVSEHMARVLSAMGDTEGLLRTYVASPDGDNLREMGKALYRQENWRESVAFYNRFWETFPGQFGVEDGSYLLVAAYHANDRETMQAVAAAFPGLTPSKGLADIANSLLESPLPLAPLRQDNATGRLESLDRSLGNIKNSGL